MNVFVTGASGFIGSAIVQELLRAGHQVTGLARSAASATAIRTAGGSVLEGTLEDHRILQQGAAAADGVIHTAFIHDFSRYDKASETDKAAIHAMGEALKGTRKPMIVTAGILGLPKNDGYITESSVQEQGLRGSEAAAMSLAAAGVYTSVVRLPPSVHDKGDKGFVPFIMELAKKKGVSAYPDEGNNRWPAVHRSDAARLYRLALEQAGTGALYNAIGETGIPVKDIAALIATKLNLPLASVAGEDIRGHFEWMSGFIGFDSPATSSETQRQLGWQPGGIGLLEDISENYA